MKSNGAVLSAFFTFAFLVVASGLSDNTWSDVSNATGRAMQYDNRCILHMDDIYRVHYCSNRACPSWKCQDDSAIIHGTCCGCPNIFGDDVPVLCVKDLKCPHLMKDLCNNYNFMILCCCSRTNNYYYNYNK
ncbi:uncharacterized protein LOC100575004 precursor [Acyrthosiphon pisum]|uniref:ACYPI27259 protein n=1 Tax=Acyrthosiphon pisum TaxID=7029 RepID=C4WVV4_ACYPI|nr:uncharacterized protein LOC100575004 precursor [Acyrthosiphon pisum]BAH72024.1 ACYPI27259 [Acyrthosiphon pisum]|eukprot:NP_001280279.1 uncharacterized protein LOC100575004 precursor [Acyrthosiphon pisum]